MPENKKKRAQLQVIFSAMLLAVSFLMEMYAIINMPKRFLVIGVLGVLILLFLYVLINGISIPIRCKSQKKDKT